MLGSSLVHLLASKCFAHHSLHDCTTGEPSIMVGRELPGLPSRKALGKMWQKSLRAFAHSLSYHLELSH